MALTRTTAAARPGVRALLCLIDAVCAGVGVLAVLTLFSVISLLVPGAGSPYEVIDAGCGWNTCARTPDFEAAAAKDIPTWYVVLFALVSLAAIAACSGACDKQRRTIGMRILSVYAMTGDAALSADEVVPPVPPRWVMVARWWIVVALFVAGSLVGQLAGGLLALVVAWAFALLPGRQTLWDRLTGVSVVELSFAKGIVPTA